MAARFKVGDKVKVVKAVDPKYKGKKGEIAEIAEDSLLPNGQRETLYSVKMADKPLKEDGSPADHEFDCLGCVKESDLGA